MYGINNKILIVDLDRHIQIYDRPRYCNRPCDAYFITCFNPRFITKEFLCLLGQGQTHTSVLHHNFNIRYNLHAHIHFALAKTHSSYCVYVLR